MSILNASQLKKFVHEKELKLGRDVLTAIEQRVTALLTESIARAKRNQRKTLLGRDV